MLPLPTIEGVIDRRVLVNYHVDAERLAALLPTPLQPQVVSGYGIGGICLIRLKELRPKGLPARLGLRSENAAHRVAVEWLDGDQRRTGVFVPRRDSNSRLNAVLGGRLFPGVHHHAQFTVTETGAAVDIRMRSRDGDASVAVQGRVAAGLPPESVFGSVSEASAFFEQGALGYSPSRKQGTLDALELDVTSWKVVPLDVTHVESSFFDDARAFPAGTVAFDSALLMRGLAHQWHQRESLCGCESREVATAGSGAGTAGSSAAP